MNKPETLCGLSEILSRRRFSLYAKVSYASASDCGPIEMALRRGCRIDVRNEGMSEKLGMTSSSLRRPGTFPYWLVILVSVLITKEWPLKN